MINFKKFLSIKIMCFALSGVLLSSSIFCSKNLSISVQAETDEFDVAQAAVYLALVTVGVFTTFQSGGLTLPAFLEFVGGSIGMAHTVHDYIHDNGDGTYTIDAELIQAVNNIICNEFIDGQVSPDENGLYSIGSQSLYVKVTAKNNPNMSFSYTYNATECITNKPVVFFYDKGQKDSSLFKFGCLFLRNNKDVVFAPAPDLFESSEHHGTTTYTAEYADGQKNTVSPGASLAILNNIAIGEDGYIIDEFSYSIPFPVFSSYSSACNALISGNYSGAVNLKKNYFDVSSRFTGLPYTGGNITVSSAKLGGIEKKIDELNNTNKSTDEKVEEILNYLQEDDSPTSPGTGDNPGGTVSGGDSGGSSGGLGGFLDGLGKLFDAVLAILGKLLEYIGKAIDLFSDTIMKVVDIIPKGFINLLTGLFPFVPPEFLVAIELILALSVILVIVRGLKK